MNSDPHINKEHLTREDINKYRKTSDPLVKNSIERKASGDSFENDALEGWSLPIASGIDLSKTDKKFKLKSNQWMIYTATLSVVAVILATIYIYNQNQNAQTPIEIAQQEITIEKTDIVLPEKIEEMVELPKNEQISVRTVQKDFEEQKITPEQKNEPNAQTQVEELPVKPLEPTVKAEKPTRVVIFGKEIYLSDMKVLDYRAYRSRPVIPTKQIVLTGTPADQGETRSNTEENYEWKTVDVPYIDYLEKSMEIFSRGNNKKALARFEEILRSYPDDLNALFYAGLCYFNLGEYDKSLAVMNSCYESKYANFREESHWYMAKAHLAKGNKETAESLLKEIRSQEGYYSKQAEKLLKNL